MASGFSILLRAWSRARPSRKPPKHKPCQPLPSAPPSKTSLSQRWPFRAAVLSPFPFYSSRRMPEQCCSVSGFAPQNDALLEPRSRLQHPLPCSFSLIPAKKRLSSHIHRCEQSDRWTEGRRLISFGHHARVDLPNKSSTTHSLCAAPRWVSPETESPRRSIRRQGL